MDKMNLLCCENATVDLDMRCKPYLDPVLLSDDRVLFNLLNLEEKYMPNSTYFSCVQTDVEPRMRDEVAQWMLDVCRDQRMEDEVFTLAMNMMDRFLSLVKVKRQQLQLLGTVCLFLASKIKESPPLHPSLLAYYTENSVTLEEIRRWELLVLSRLKWDLAAITPHAFLDQIIVRLHLTFTETQIRLVRDTATHFITMCATESRFTSNPPSMVAAAAVSSAIQALLHRDEKEDEEEAAAVAVAISLTPPGGHTSAQQFMQDLFHRLHIITQIDTDCLKECHLQIENWTQSSSDSLSRISESTTPIDVQKVLI